MAPEPIEYEHGIAIPGRILPESEWAKTAIKRLPAAGPLDWQAIFGRNAPIVLDLGCGNGRFTLSTRRQPAGFRSFRHRFLARRHPLRDPSRQSTRTTQRALRGQRCSNVLITLRCSWDRVGNSRLSSTALSRPEKGILAPPDATVTGRFSSRDCAGRQLRRADRQSRLLGLYDRRAALVLRLQRASRALADAPQGGTRREILARERGLTVFRGVGTRRDDLSQDRLTSIAESLPLPKFRSRGPWCDLDQREQAEHRG